MTSREDGGLDHYTDPDDPFWQSNPEVPEPQGEPSDAEVLAALNARDAWMHRTQRRFEPAPELDGFFAEREQGAMRTALRAAAAVREEGQGR